jgi:hypothetical protein
MMDTGIRWDGEAVKRFEPRIERIYANGGMGGRYGGSEAVLVAPAAQCLVLGAWCACGTCLVLCSLFFVLCSLFFVLCSLCLVRLNCRSGFLRLSYKKQSTKHAAQRQSTKHQAPSTKHQAPSTKHQAQPTTLPPHSQKFA